VRANWTAADGWKLQKQLDCVEGLREQAVALQQEMIDERERQASWQRHRYYKDRVKNREPRSPRPMSQDTSGPSNFDSWSHVFAVKGPNRAHTHAQGPNAVNEYAQDINDLLETQAGAASVDLDDPQLDIAPPPAWRTAVPSATCRHQLAICIALRAHRTAAWYGCTFSWASRTCSRALLRRR